MYFSFKEKSLRYLYNILLHPATLLLKITASFSKKIQLGVKGRAKTIEFLKLKISSDTKVLWFHCASLGEYEQGLPVFEEIKFLYPDYKNSFEFFLAFGLRNS